MPTDILLNDYVPMVKKGDLVIGESTRQHQLLLLVTEPGELRRFPTRGVGINNYLSDEDNGQLRLAIKKEYEADGMKVSQIRAIGSKVNVEGSYE